MVNNVPTKLRETLANMKAGTTKAEIAISLQKTQDIDTVHARVLLSIPAAFQNRINDDNLAVAVASMQDGVRYLPGSIHRASNRDKTLFGAFVAKTKETMTMEQASAAGMTSVSDTVFQDANDAIWTVRKDGDTAYLVKQADEDISSLLSAVRARAIATASLEVAMAEDYSPGMPVLFYDLGREEVAFGIAYNGTTVYDGKADKLTEVASEQVINVIDNKRLPIEKAADGGKDEILSYMRQLYSQNPQFLAEIENIIRNGVQV